MDTSSQVSKKTFMLTHSPNMFTADCHYQTAKTIVAETILELYTLTGIKLLLLEIVQ